MRVDHELTRIDDSAHPSLRPADEEPAAARRAVLWLGGVALMLGAIVSTVVRWAANTEEATADDVARERLPRGLGVTARAFDPARVVVRWRDPDTDPADVEKALKHALPGDVVAQQDMGANAWLGPWLAGFVSEDEFGQAMAACRLEHERRQSRPCRWRQSVVLARGPEGGGRVVGVEAHLDPDRFVPLNGAAPTPECAAWARCVVDAWRGRKARYPSGVEDVQIETAEGGGMIALDAIVSHGQGYGLTLDDYVTHYERRAVEYDAYADRREAYYGSMMETDDEATDRRRDNVLYLLLQDRATADDARAYVDYVASHAGHAADE
ncbi:MAG: hypothetical protein D6705_03275 [Deltaproteobacteria bacterium]|nr:MAG: hypothetical protein D6705_03275 [Deltaproteobacteria bacterium]